MWPRIPPDFEFYNRDFLPGASHDPDEGVLAFARSYPDQWELEFRFTRGECTLTAIIRHTGRVITELTAEQMVDSEFQSWHGEQILRISCADGLDLRIHHAPMPSLHCSRP